MGADSTADLLFRISGDSTPAQDDLATLRKAVSEGVADSGAQFESLNVRTAASTREAREAIRGLGEEIGVHMPRFVASWLSSLGGVSSVMAMAFAPIAVIGFVEVLAKIPEALEKGIDWLHGWTAEAKKAFEESTKYAMDWQTKSIEISERVRAIQLIGKEGMEKYNLEMVLNSKSISEVKAKLEEMGAAAARAQAILNWKPPEQSSFLARSLGLAGGPSHEEIEKAKTQLKELDPVIKALTDKLTELTIKSKEIPAEAAAEVAKETGRETKDFRELSVILDEVQGKLAKATSAEAEIGAEMNRLGDATHRAVEKLEKLNEEADPKDKHYEEWVATYQREVAALQQVLPLLSQLQNQMYADLDKKRGDEIARAQAALNEKLDAELIHGLVEKAREEKELADKQQREELAYQGEMARLGEQRAHIEKAYQTSEERITGQYAADVAKFDAAEEQKTLTAARNDQERAAIAAGFASIRDSLLTKEQVQLQALHNSQGWQGVFGNEFAQLIKRNEALTNEWASSTDQSLMLVRVSLESFKEMAQDALSQLEQGMASNIVHAVIYKQSIGEAMKAATEAVIEQVAQQAAVKAIEASAWGFFDLATGDFPGAAAAFESAALFGSVAAAASIAGRAIGPSQGGASGAGAGASASSSSASASGYSAAGGQQTPHVQVNVWGYVFGISGVQELCSAINDAVLNKDVPLTATNTKTGVQVTR